MLLFTTLAKLSARRGEAVSSVEAMVRRAGAIVLFIPPCNPSFNPIEPMFGVEEKAAQAAAERRSTKVPSTIVWKIYAGNGKRLSGSSTIVV